MKININKIITLLILIIIYFLSIFLIIEKKIEFSENENRYLQNEIDFSFKRVFNKEYITDLEKFLSDQFPFRDLFISIKTKSDKLTGHQDENGVYFAKNNYLIERYNEPKNNKKISNKLNEFTKNLNYINFNLMLVPTSISINKNLLPKNAITFNQLKSINYIYNNVNFDTIDIYNILNQNKNNYQLFYKLDHHWTSYGAYYGYYEYCLHNNINPIKISNFEIKEVSNNFYGTLYSKTADYCKKPDSIHIFSYKEYNIDVEYVLSKKITKTLYNKDYLSKKDKYSYFLDNNHPLIVINNNEINNNKEILIIKDSYANSFIPFLVNHYKKIHVIDPRFYKISVSNYLKENKNIKDVLFLYNVNTLDNDTGIMSLR